MAFIISMSRLAKNIIILTFENHFKQLQNKTPKSKQRLCIYKQAKNLTASGPNTNSGPKNNPVQFKTTD